MSNNRVLANKARRVDLTGKTFNRLTPIKYLDEDQKYLCRCSCGKTTKVRAAALKNGGTKSCGCLQRENASKSAKELHKAKRRSRGLPEDVPISSEDSLKRLDIKELTKVVFKRDQYTCCLCSCVGGQLQAHHIELWSENTDLRDDPSNLVTLCKDCHYMVHDFNWFGEPNRPLNILLRGYIAVMLEKINESV